MEYPARFILDKEVGGYVVSFPDVQEARTQGDTTEKEMPRAPNAACASRQRPALAEAKFKLYSALRAAGIKKIELTPAQVLTQLGGTACSISITPRASTNATRRSGRSSCD